MRPEFALSIKPPWAYFIIYGVPYGVEVKKPDGSSSVESSGKVIIKDIENREWAIPPSFKLPQRIMVHVSKKEDDITGVMDYTVGKLKLPAFPIIMYYSKRLPRGAIIGEVTITDCVTESKSPWFTGKYGFTLADAMPYEKPIPCRGALGFFKPNIPKEKVKP
ncbi:MAG: hypothetical protein PHN44_01250 [Candidatus Marinimicrobia bacterium]|nr:hypothetical protein [Candidatus Neomarinimicrobiota bacterium]MDD5539079.1 hypothetical protein [Candidatus Neomarinimicrobiota bacterium]